MAFPQALLPTTIATWLACYRWETGPEPRMAGEMAVGHFSGGGGPEMAEKWSDKWLDSQNLADFWLSSHLSGHFFGHFATPPEKWPPAISPAISPAILGSGPVSHSVAGQPSRKTTIVQHPLEKN